MTGSRWWFSIFWQSKDINFILIKISCILNILTGLTSSFIHLRKYIACYQISDAGYSVIFASESNGDRESIDFKIKYYCYKGLKSLVLFVCLIPRLKIFKPLGFCSQWWCSLQQIVWITCLNISLIALQGTWPPMCSKLHLSI